MICVCPLRRQSDTLIELALSFLMTVPSQNSNELNHVPHPSRSDLAIVLGPELIFVTGLVTFVTAVVRLVCPNLLG